MAVERVSGGSSVIDVLDRILDKGVVMDVWARIALAGTDLTGTGARVALAPADGDGHVAAERTAVRFVPPEGEQHRKPAEFSSRRARRRR